MKNFQLFFLRFVLAQVTVYMAWMQVKAISDYVNNDLAYYPMGPYMIKSSKIPNADCHQFYKQQQLFIEKNEKIITRKQYMEKVYQATQNNHPTQEMMITIVTVIVTIALEVFSFMDDQNPVLLYLDHLFTLLLPHFTLMMNAISWGDTCIEDSWILNVVDYVDLYDVGPITFTILIVMVVLLLISAICDLFTHFFWSVFMGLLGCGAIFYIILIDAIVQTVSSPLELALFVGKFILLVILEYELL